MKTHDRKAAGMWAWTEDWWPHFTYRTEDFYADLYEAGKGVIRAQAELERLGPTFQEKALLELQAEELVKSFEIEGVTLSRDNLRSSLEHQLVAGQAPAEPTDHKAASAVALLKRVQAQFRSDRPLTREDLFAWQDLVIRTEDFKVKTGGWRDGDIGVGTGEGAARRVVYEAPPSARVNAEMDRFLSWFNSTRPSVAGEQRIPGPVRAAIAHLWFEQIHPFADGNGRVGRGIGELALAQDLGAWPPYSLSSAIREWREGYYRELERAGRQVGSDITPWIASFVETVRHAQEKSREITAFVLTKAQFFDRIQDAALHERQKKALTDMLEGPTESFKGGLTARKYTAMTGAAPATAFRDLSELQERGFLVRLPGAGRSGRYALNLDLTTPDMKPLKARDAKQAQDAIKGLSVQQLRGTFKATHEALEEQKSKTGVEAELNGKALQTGYKVLQAKLIEDGIAFPAGTVVASSEKSAGRKQFGSEV